MLTRRILLWLSLTALVVMLPAFIVGAGGGDLHCQSLWTVHFSRELWSGHLYPRWLPDLNAGNGSPAFFYYPPLAYYISALFYPLASLDPFGYIPMAMSALLAALCSGITFFLWIREDVSESSALLASILYIVLPFHMGHSFFYVLLYSTVWAYAWLPLLLIAARRIAQNKPYGIITGSISVALMLCTNMPSALITLLLTCAYGLSIPRTTTFAVLCKNAVFSGVLGIGLAAFFLLPSLLYTKYGVVDLHWSDPRHEVSHFFTVLGFHSWGQTWNSCVWLEHGLLVVMLYYFSRTHAALSTRRFMLIASIIALLMMLSFGYWLWQVIPVLATLQHPWRLFIILSLAISTLAAFSLPKHQKCILALILCSLAIDWMLAFHAHTTPEKLKEKDPIAYERYRMQVEQYPEYLSFLSLIKRYYTADGMAQVKQHMAPINSGVAHTHILVWEARHIVFSYDAPAQTTISVRQMYYPGMQAFSHDTALPTAWDDDTGQVTITLPEGSGTAELDLLPLWPETLGKLLSLISIAALTISILLTKRRRLSL